jgi:hypothetical protein
MEENRQSNQESKSNLVDDVKEFYNGNFKNILFSFFKNPISGIYSIIEKPSEKANIQSLSLYVFVFFTYLICCYFIMPAIFRDTLDFSFFIKLSLIPLIMMFVISCLSFAIKSLSSKPDFKNELFMGAICGIPLSIFILVLLIMSFLIDSFETEGKSALGFYNSVNLLILFYSSLMLINVFQQSLKSGRIKEGIAWYLSPTAVLIAFYITFQIATNFLFENVFPNS